MEYIGYIAAVLTTVSFLPQVIHTIRVKDTTGISLYNVRTTYCSVLFVGYLMALYSARFQL